MDIRVLHCYGDYKWTGPSEPVVALVGELCRRGLRSELACVGMTTRGNPALAHRARQAGLAVHDQFWFESSPNVRKNLRDVQSLMHLVLDGGFHIIHAHGSWDHVLGAVAARRLPGSPCIIRTDHGGREFTGDLHHCIQFGPAMTDHLIVLSDRLRARAVCALELSPQRVTTVRGGIDPEDFRPCEPPSGIRSRFGLSERDVVFGVVARVQRHRRFEIILRAASIARTRNRRIKMLVLGRGTFKTEVLDRPVSEMALEDSVFPIGYRRRDYLEVLSMIDAGIMLVPGSDASCRAAMQMAAMAKPLVVARRGVLPDIVVDGRTGIVVDDTPENLAEALVQMAQDSERRLLWGQAARERILTYFTLARQAEQVEELYGSVLNCKR